MSRQMIGSTFGRLTAHAVQEFEVVSELGEM